MFQKSGVGSGSVVASGGGKKTRLNSNTNLYPEPSSPSSVSLPPLLDSSLYAAAGSSSNAATDHDISSCYDVTKEIVISLMYRIQSGGDDLAVQNSDLIQNQMRKQ